MTQGKITFWGTRGSYPIASPSTLQTGGRTSCVSVEWQNTLFILDAGTGLIALGDELRIKNYTQAHLLLSHVHLDHILGIPFFKPIFHKNWTLNFYASIAAPYGGLEKVLSTCFSPPYFPLEWEKFPSRRLCHDFSEGQCLTIKGHSVRTLSLDHPGGACGYRLELQDKSIVYLTDTKHTPALTTQFIEFCQNTDLLIYDATFTDEEFALHPDWGHSTWHAATVLAQAAGVKKLALFHHNPAHTDQQMQQILNQAVEVFPETLLSYDGLEVTL